MADRIVGLVGPGKGPMLCTSRAKHVCAVVVGLPNEEHPVEIHVVSDDRLSTHVMLVNGKMGLPAAEHMQFEYKGKARVVCSLELK